MCFTITITTKRLTKKIAKQDIPVWKVIRTDGSGLVCDMIDSKGTIVEWEKGYIYTEKPAFSKTEITKYGDFYEVNGSVFHSRKTKKYADRLKTNGNHKTVEMYIPKGARYLENDSEYISSDIVYDSLPEHKTMKDEQNS